MNYICITPYYPSNDSFYGNYIHDQIKALVELSDFNIIVIKLNTPWRGIVRPFYYFEGIKVHNYQYLDLPFWIFPGLFNSLNKYLFCRFIKKLVPNLNEKDIIHAHVIH